MEKAQPAGQEEAGGCSTLRGVSAGSGKMRMENVLTPEPQKGLKPSSVRGPVCVCVASTDEWHVCVVNVEDKSCLCVFLGSEGRAGCPGGEAVSAPYVSCARPPGWGSPGWGLGRGDRGDGGLGADGRPPRELGWLRAAPGSGTPGGTGGRARSRPRGARHGRPGDRLPSARRGRESTRGSGR